MSNNASCKPIVFFTLTLMIISLGWCYGRCHAEDLQLNDQGYLECRGFNVVAFENPYNGLFFDEKTSGVLLIHHGVRTATGGAVRLNPTPEQWDPIPVVAERTVSKETNSVEILLRYEDYDFECTVRVEAAGPGFRMSVHLDKPLPSPLEERAGLNLEFLPSAYLQKTYQMDGKVAIFPLHPSSSMQVMPADKKFRQFAGHSTFDDRDRGEFIEPKPMVSGKSLVLAPEDAERRIQIQSTDENKLTLLDGRTLAQNGWYVVRTLIPAGQTGKVVEWVLTPSIIPNWKRDPVIGYSQVGYHPAQEKVAVIELDPNDQPHKSAKVQRLSEQGDWERVLESDVQDWGDFYRYHYLRFDFSGVREPGLYRIQYGDEVSGPIPVGTEVFDELWQSTLDVWFPVQMDHMMVNEAYRVWHGAAHLDDALQAPINHQHFDGYRSGDSTETQYEPGQRIPGLNIGGWFDAGDFDIRTGSHCNTVLALAETWQRFQLARDETLVDQPQRYVDLHHPDGKPDLLQQIEHGTLALIAQHRAFGRAIPGIIVPNLHQYHHLGDGVTMTDNLPYSPQLEPYQIEGGRSGTPDDRWAFTGKSASANYASIAALASSSRALRGYNDELADECLAAARAAWTDEQQQPEEDNSPFARFSRGAELPALLQLYVATQDEQYAQAFQERLWPLLERDPQRGIGLAARAIPHLGDAYKQKLAPYVTKQVAANNELHKVNPYGVPITTYGWAGNSAVINWALTNDLLHRAYPDLIGPEYAYRGLSYILGCHPYSNTSFVSGIGLKSKQIAYGSNRADFSFIAGGVVPGVLLIKPDFFENKDDWPYLWGENEYVIDICAEYILLANAVRDLAKQED